MANYLVGLGNPGSSYQFTRHNAGFMLLDYVADQAKLAWQVKRRFKAEVAESEQIVCLKPQTYMNAVGESVVAYRQFYKLSSSWLERLYVVFDDLDLEVGTFKIQFGKGPKVHNGLDSIYQHLGSTRFWHVRLGIDGRQGDRSISGAEYVLSSFPPPQKKLFDTALVAATQQILHDKKI